MMSSSGFSHTHGNGTILLAVIVVYSYDNHAHMRKYITCL